LKPGWFRGAKGKIAGPAREPLERRPGSARGKKRAGGVTF
jgi:hypothetical protein